MLMPTTSRERRARRLSATTSAPLLLKPMRFKIALSSGKRNKRGVGLPGWDFGVTVPISA